MASLYFGRQANRKDSMNHFTPYYEWAANMKDITLPEALVLCRVYMWGNAGCFESYATLAKNLKLCRRTVINAVAVLEQKKYVRIEYLSRYKRTIFFNFQRTNLPIFDKKSGAFNSLPAKQSSASNSPSGESHAPVVVNDVHHTIYYTRQDEIKEKTIENLSKEMTIQTGLTKNQRQERKEYMLQQLKLLEKESPGPRRFS